MDKLSPKQILSLAKACRKAGITQFKGLGVEFTLGAEPLRLAKVKAPVSHVGGFIDERPKTVTVQGPNGPVEIELPNQTPKDDIPTDAPTREELLFWSVGEEAEG